MTRVLFLEALPTIAGGQQVLLDMLPALRDYELHALLPDAGPLSDALIAEGVACHFTPMARYTLVRKNLADVARFPLDQIRLAFRCARLARRLQPDLIYANSSRTFVWGTLGALMARRPIVWHVHNLLGDRKTLALIRRLGRRPIVRRVVAVSSAAAEQFPNLAHKTSIVPTGVDTTIFQPNSNARTRVRRELGLSPNALVVGIVGDLIPLKGQHTLLQAARLLPLEVRYLVVGDARPGDDESQSYASGLRKMAGSKVAFTGRREDLPEVFNALDLLVVASERETGPLVLLYALACGVPVISTSVGRAPALLPPEAMFPVNNAAALADRLEYWLADSQRLRTASRAARSLAEEQLTLESFRARMCTEIERNLE